MSTEKQLVNSVPHTRGFIQTPYRFKINESDFSEFFTSK